MAEFLTTQGTSYYIEKIIQEATSRLVLISPYLQLSTNFYARLRDAENKGIQIIIIYGKDKLQHEEREQIEKLKNVSLFFCENLHAKCYFNDNNMVITSMNMYEFSEKNNREMGVLINRQTDKDTFEKAQQEYESIKSSSKQERTSKYVVKHNYYEKPEKVKPQESFLDTIKTVLTGNNQTGYCIRCGKKIPYNTDHPLCSDCFKDWIKHKNPEYPERHCHSCGKERKTSFSKPECRSCFKS